MTNKDDISELIPADIQQMKYFPVSDHDKWKIPMVKELIDVKWGEALIDNLSNSEIDDIIEDICTS